MSKRARKARRTAAMRAVGSFLRFEPTRPRSPVRLRFQFEDRYAPSVATLFDRLGLKVT